MKRDFARLLVLSLLLCLVTGCGTPGEAPLPPAIRNLAVKRLVLEPAALGDAEPWSRYWAEPDTVNADLTHSPGLAYSLTVGNNTAFNGGLPAGYDLQGLIEWGKDPGLNVDILHAHGFTGGGAIIAYIDQGVLPHPEYDRENIHITNTGNYPLSMHGPAVLSLLAGESIGVAPDAEIYYLGCDSGDGYSQLHEADCLYRVIDLNETLPEGQKIRMVGFSDNISSGEPYEQEFRAAAKACEEAGIMVWFCGENGAVAFLPWSDKNDPGSLAPEHWGGGHGAQVCFPSAGRTVACVFDPAHYVHYASGGLSWTMPYALGLYAIALSIDPGLTQTDLRTIARDTADEINDGSKRVVDPVEFVAAVLERVGRDGEARELREEVRARQKYLYAVVDQAAMSKEDQRAVFDALAWITEARVVVADASRFADGAELYAAIETDLRERGGTLAGYQLFGEVPQPPDEGSGETPPVWRLNLGKGEYVTFFRDYLEAARAGEPDTLADGVLFPPNRAGMTLCDAEGTLGH